VNDAGPAGVVYRLRYELSRNGPRAAIRRVAGGMHEQLLLDETHIWYEVSTGDGRPRVGLPEGFAFRRAGADLLPLIKQLPTIFEGEGARRLAAGHDLWLLLDGDRPAFACWTLRRAMPVPGAPNGVLVLPPGTVCVEDSVTAPEYRGRRLGPAAWTLIADEISREGIPWLITKIRDDNVPTQKSVLKAGFAEMARVRFRRVLGRSRTAVTGASGPNGAYLERVLT
jgi:hypothetical protein